MRHYRQLSAAAEEAYPLHPGARIGGLRARLRLLFGRIRMRSIEGSAGAGPSEATQPAVVDRASPLKIAGDPYRAATLFPFIPVRPSTGGLRARDKLRKESLS